MAENDALAQQDDMADFKARCSDLSGLQGAWHASTMKASHPELIAEQGFSRAFSYNGKTF